METEGERERAASAGIAVLVVTGSAAGAHCAAQLADLGFEFEIAGTQEAALAALHSRQYAAVVVDDSVAEADARAADALWREAGGAVLLQVNFAITGGARLAREVRAALARREQQEARARQTVAAAMERELKTTVTGLLLHSQLALAEPTVPPQLADKLKLVVELAGTLKQQLERAQA